jgi:hypothetical protein
LSPSDDRVFGSGSRSGASCIRVVVVELGPDAHALAVGKSYEDVLIEFEGKLLPLSTEGSGWHRWLARAGASGLGS